MKYSSPKDLKTENRNKKLVYNKYVLNNTTQNAVNYQYN